MQKVTFGRLGWQVSVAGLGCGGPSRLGTRAHQDQARAAEIVRAAIDSGVNFIDTARGYDTEKAVGLALADYPNDQLYVATKVSPTRQGVVRPVQEIRDDLDTSLRQLGRDHIDLYQLHGVLPHAYHDSVQQLVPALLQWKEQGLIRALGISERFESDTTHQMLQNALDDDCWDSMMVGFNLLNPSAQNTLLPTCQEKGIGTLIMFAVRRVFSNPDRATQVIQQLIDTGELNQATLESEGIDCDAPFDFLLEEANTIPEAAYRYCRHTPGCDVILTGTGNPQHLHENLQAIQQPALSPQMLNRLHQLFGHIQTATGG